MIGISKQQQLWKKPKRITAKFSKKVKEEILARDWRCVLCPSDKALSCHHIFYGIWAEHWTDRNNVNKGCLTCGECHHSIHHWSNSQKLRMKAIKYVYDYYWNKETILWDLK